MPAYRSSTVQRGDIKVRPIGWRRIWPLRWWFPYFTGSKVRLQVTVTPEALVYCTGEVSSDNGGHSMVRLSDEPSKETRTVCFETPDTDILPDGMSIATFSLHEIEIGEDRNIALGSDTVEIAKFIAWDPDEFVFRRFVPFVIFIAATVSIGVLA